MNNPIIMFWVLFGGLGVVAGAVGWVCILSWEVCEAVAEMAKRSRK